MIRVAVDAMGGDNAPAEIIKGAAEAVRTRKDIQVILVGKEDVIGEHLKNYSLPEGQIEVKGASEVIETEEPPVNAIRKKKDSSIVVGMNMVKAGEADAFVSAGSSGAILVGGQVIVGRIKGVERPPLAPLIPTETGVSLLIDCGANVDARPSHLVQFARMGAIYMEHVVGIKNPRVAIVNIGAEEEKGNALVKETFPLLKAVSYTHLIISRPKAPERAASSPSPAAARRSWSAAPVRSKTERSSPVSTWDSRPSGAPSTPGSWTRFWWIFCRNVWRQVSILPIWTKRRWRRSSVWPRTSRPCASIWPKMTWRLSWPTARFSPERAASPSCP